MIASGKEILEIPQSLWEGIPENSVRILRVFQSALMSQDSSIQKIFKTLPVPNAKLNEKTESDFAIRDLTSKIKEIEQNSSRKLALISTKTASKIESLEADLDLLKKDLATALGKFNLSPVYQEIQNSKSLVKSEIQDELIQPFEYELKDLVKTINLIEQQVKVQTWNIEASLKEVDCRFEVHREKICKIENIASEFSKEVAGIILQQIEPIKEEMLETEDKTRDLYAKFKKRSERALSDLTEMGAELTNNFQKAVDDLAVFKLDVNKTTKTIITTNSLHIQKIDASITQVHLNIENFKTELKIYQRTCYEEAKSALSQSYSKEIAVINDKLRWLPSNLNDISEMTPIEARLFTIETRIKTEELNRIGQFNDLLKGIKHIDRPLVEYKKKKKKKNHSGDIKVAFPTSRCVTPCPASTKICMSPGGMRLRTSISHRKVSK